MSSIDERIVKMRLDNSQFEQGVNKTSNLLSKLKSSLNLNKSVESISNVDKAVKGINFAPVTSGLQGVQSGFNAMGAVAFSVLNRMTNAAIDAGQRIASSLTEAARDGFAEYETQLDSVQTILSNTMSKGTNLDQVNRALDTLNTYADKTIYNFTEMTKNIGTFTAAGVDLQTSVDSIKGIANLAAASGSSSAQAASAMYQLSQALAAGKIQLMDWNSVVNAGMGGELFQNALKRTAKHFGKDVDGMIKEYGSFRESLTKGQWLTADVMTETLKQISGAYTEADLIEQGYTKQQAKDIVKLANTANDAATKVKTFTQLIDTTKEALGSGWTQSWQIIIGDFEESKDLWTGISDQINNIVNTSANARNELLSSGLSSGWKQLLSQGIADTAGFQEIMTQTARDHGVAIDDMITKNGSFTKSMHEGWVTADIVSESVNKMTDKMSKMSKKELQAAGYTSENVEQIKKLNEQLQNGSLSAKDFADKMNRMSGRENVITGLTNVFNDLSKIFERIGKVYREVFPAMTGDELYTLTERFKDFTKTLTPSEKTLDRIGRIAKGVFSVFDIGAQVIKAVGEAIATAFGSGNAGTLLDNFLDTAARFGDWLVELDKSIKQFGVLDGAAKKVGTTISDFLGTFNSFTEKVSLSSSTIKSVASTINDTLGKAFEHVKSVISDVTTWISNNVSAGDIFAGLAGGGIFVAAKKIASTFETIKEAVDNIFGKGEENLKKGAGVFEDVLSGLSDSLSAFTENVKATTLVEISGAIALLVHSMEKIAALSGGEVVGGVAAIGGLMGELNLSLVAISKSMKAVDTKDLIKTGLALMEFSKSIEMLAEAMDTVGRLNLDEVVKGLAGIGGAMAEFVVASKALNRVKLKVKTATSLVIMAQAVKMVAEPLKKLGGMSWKSIGKGLSAMGGALVEMGTVTGLLGRFGGFNLSAAASIVITAKSLADIASAFDSFTKYDWGEIGRGLVAMGGALTEVGLVTGALGKLAGISGLIGAGSIVLAAQGLGKIASAFDSFSKHDWGEVGRGLTAMGGALGEVGLVTGALGKLAGVSGLIGAGSIVLAAQGLGTIASAFDSFTKYDWGEIGRGLVAMGGALTEVGAISGALGMLAGISGLIGAGSIVFAAQGLGKIASAFAEFTKYDWGEIGRGLVAMGGALAEVGAISGALGMLAGLSGILGAGTIVIAAQGLGQVASIFDSFTKYDWGEIGRGLVAMGGAMAEVAVISGATGALTGIAGLVGAGTIALASQGLNELATSFGKFAEFNWDEIGRGLTAMGAAMGETALGGLLNTFSGFGARAISEMAKPLGTLADSVKKWEGVSVPDDLASQLGQLSAGIFKFTLAGWGGDTISNIAQPMGVLADSLSKWSNITFSAGIGDQLKTLASGVQSFTFAFAGGWSLNAVVGPLGQLADSVKKWNGVTIPKGIGSGLSDLANGVKSFTFALVGGWSLDAISGPFGNFADSVKKWNKVTIPAGIKTGLTNLADGIKAFSLSFVGGWSLNAVTGPLGQLADSVKKWNGVTIPAGTGTGLSNLANGVNAFASVGGNVGTNMASVANGLRSISSASAGIASANLSGTANQISTFVSTLNATQSIASTLPEQISSFSTQLSTAMIALRSTVSSNSAAIVSAFSSLRSQVTNAISGLGSTVSSNMSSASNAIRSSAPKFLSAGKQISTSLITGLKTDLNRIPTMFNSTINSAVTNIRSFRSSFYSAGTYVAQGFASGIDSQVGIAAAAAARLAKAAYEAAKEALGIHSPSKVFGWIGEMTVDGFVNKVDGMKTEIRKSGYGMAESVIRGFNDLDVSSISDPSIRPVMDLSVIRRQASDLSSMLSTSTNPIKADIDYIGRLERQNGADYQTEMFNRLISATNENVKELSDLRDDISRYNDSIANQETAVYVDGKKLASTIAKPMDQALGLRQRRGI